MTLKDLIATPGEAAAARVVKLFRYTGEAGEQLRCAIEDEVDKAVAAERERLIDLVFGMSGSHNFTKRLREKAERA